MNEPPQEADRSAGLFEPSLQGEAPAAPGGSRSWHLESQFAVAFFGGGGALTTIVYLNARRLAMTSGERRAIAATGLGGWAVAIAAAPFLGTGFGYTLVVVATWAVLRRRQREADRRYHYFATGDSSYASLWGPGLAAVVGFRALEALAVYLLVVSL